MENASKALILATGILIGVMVISLAVYLFITFGNYSKEISSIVDKKNLAEFNNQFLKFDGLTNVTAHDIVSIANLARENNIKYDLDELSESEREDENNYYIEVKLGKSKLERKEDHYEFLRTSSSMITNEVSNETNEISHIVKKIYYKCTITVSEITKRVKTIKFELI